MSAGTELYSACQWLARWCHVPWITWPFLADCLTVSVSTWFSSRCYSLLLCLCMVHLAAKKKEYFRVIFMACDWPVKQAVFHCMDWMWSQRFCFVISWKKNIAKIYVWCSFWPCMFWVKRTFLTAAHGRPYSFNAFDAWYWYFDTLSVST